MNGHIEKEMEWSHLTAYTALLECMDYSLIYQVLERWSLPATALYLGLIQDEGSCLTLGSYF